MNERINILKTIVEIATSLGVVQLVFHCYKAIRNRQLDRQKLCDRIGAKYYETIKTVALIRSLANTITPENWQQLEDVNRELHHFWKLIMNIPNEGSPNDIEISEVRKLFSDDAGDCILRLGQLFGELDREGKDPSVWHLVNSQIVVLLSTQILAEWDSLVRIMAKKRWMQFGKLKREYFEKAEAL